MSAFFPASILRRASVLVRPLPSALAMLALLISSTAFSQVLGVATPRSQGMSDEGLQRVTDRLQQHIDDGDIAGAVATVIRNGKIVYFESLGYLNLEHMTPMPEDAIFRVYSMAREVTSAAALKLYEEGKYEFDDPIQKYLPEFANQRVLIDSESTDITQTRERMGDIRIADLFVHTSGLGSRSSRLYRENNVRDRNISLDEMVSNAARVPLFQDPGTEFRYGIHATILGKLIEVWSGVSFQDYLQANILDPLGMDSTMFWVEGSDVSRLAQLYRPTDGQLLPYQIESIPFTMRPRLIEGGVGLLSSVQDFAHFSQMILDDGMFDGRQIFKPETVALMYENAVPEAAMPIGTRGYWAGSGWTLGGFNLVLDPQAYSFPVSEGTIWWDGSAGTRYFIDPEQNMVTVIMGQVSPSRGGGFRENFTTLVDEAIVDRY